MRRVRPLVVALAALVAVGVVIFLVQGGCSASSGNGPAPDATPTTGQVAPGAPGAVPATGNPAPAPAGDGIEKPKPAAKPATTTSKPAAKAADTATPRNQGVKYQVTRRYRIVASGSTPKEAACDLAKYLRANALNGDFANQLQAVAMLRAWGFATQDETIDAVITALVDQGYINSPASPAEGDREMTGAEIGLWIAGLAIVALLVIWGLALLGQYLNRRNAGTENAEADVAGNIGAFRTADTLPALSPDTAQRGYQVNRDREGRVVRMISWDDDARRRQAPVVVQPAPQPPAPPVDVLADLAARFRQLREVQSGLNPPVLPATAADVNINVTGNGGGNGAAVEDDDTDLAEQILQLRQQLEEAEARIAAAEEAAAAAQTPTQTT